MKNYRPAMSFDEEVASQDRDLQRGDEAAAVALLAEMAGPGPALELGIGTGRIALPLAARGVRVDGTTCPRRWSTNCALGRAATSLRSRSATLPQCPLRASTG